MIPLVFSPVLAKLSVFRERGGEKRREEEEGKGGGDLGKGESNTCDK